MYLWVSVPLLKAWSLRDLSSLILFMPAHKYLITGYSYFVTTLFMNIFQAGIAAPYSFAYYLVNKKLIIY